MVGDVDRIKLKQKTDCKLHSVFYCLLDINKMVWCKANTTGA